MYFFNKKIRLKIIYKYNTKINHCLKNFTAMTGHNYTVSDLVNLSVFLLTSMLHAFLILICREIITKKHMYFSRQMPKV